MRIFALLILCFVTATQLFGSTADLAISLEQSPQPVVAGQSVTYTIVTTNLGPRSAEATVGIAFDEGMQVLTVGISQGTYSINGLEVYGSTGVIPSGGSVVLMVTAIGLVEGDVGYYFGVETEANDPDYDNNYGQGTTTLLAGPGIFSFSRPSYSVNEGAGAMSIIVNRAGGAIGTVTVDYASSNLTATAGSDYTTLAGTLTFAHGVTAQTVTLPITEDAASECNEDLLLTLNNPSGGAILLGEQKAKVLIFDNDLTGVAQLEAVSVAAGTPPNPTAAGDSYRFVLSGDGRFIAFSSWADDLVDNDLNGEQDIFVRDLANHTTRLISVNRFGSASGAGSSEAPHFSSDGSKIVFLSEAPDLVAVDTNQVGDIFLRNTATLTTTLISVDQTGTRPANGVSFHPAMSADGRYVAFASRATDLVSNDTNLDEADVYLRDTQTGVTELISVNGEGTGSANGISHTPAVSPDGRYVAFISYANDLGPADSNDTYDLYVRDRLLQTNLLISANLARARDAH